MCEAETDNISDFMNYYYYLWQQTNQCARGVHSKVFVESRQSSDGCLRFLDSYRFGFVKVNDLNE